jgi:hypothetical protein
MPERDTDLTRLFVRDLDDIALPARDQWRPAPRKESALMKASRMVLAATAVAAVLVLALIASFGLRDGNPVAAPQTASPSATATTTASPQPSASASPARTTSLPNVTQPTGVITGRIGYGSDFNPPMTVYAISVTDPSVWYSTNTPYLGNPRPSPTPTPLVAATWSPAGAGFYQLVVPAGTYYVVGYSNDPELPKDLPAAYTEWTMRCMSSDPARPSPPPGPCPYPRTLVEVTVTAGQTVRFVDLVDWGYQPVPWPTRPTPR